jgi:FkbH-like protein
MHNAVSTFVSATGGEKQKALRELLIWLKKSAETNPAEAASVLRGVLVPDLDYSTVDALSRCFKSLKKSLPATAQTSTAQTKKLAILGSFTTHQLAAFIELYLFTMGLSVEVYEADYGQIHQEILDQDSGLHTFKPDILFLAPNRRSLGRRPEIGDTPARVDELVKAEVSDWFSLWHAAHEQMGCQIIQNNFEPAPSRSLGNHEMRHHAGFSRFIAEINLALQDAAPPFVAIHDVDHLSAAAGRWAWGDDRFYFHAKMPCAPEFLAAYAHSVASVIAAACGLAKKCLVLDLDNTIWGGVIGDDGIGGIRLGQGDAEGEAFHAIQHYVKDLAARGVILAVCSKNTDSVAREAFAKHPQMVLKLDEIACFVANWDDKGTNLRRIARQLEIGLDSLVFLDDNPAERALVRQMVPEVAVPELPDDPAGYILALDRHAYFQTVSIGSEDLHRGAMYQANAHRQKAELAVGNINDFLKSLEMKARVEPVTRENLERTAQLIGKSNQFNLTTRRHSATAVMKMADDPQWITATISLADRFGDNGLICVILARADQSDLVIDTWLMSCRVLKRGVEAFVRNYLCRTAKARGLTALRGEYIPTAKNALVKEHYPNLGFEKLSVEPGGHSCWRLDVDTAAPLPHFIQDISNHG